MSTVVKHTGMVRGPKGQFVSSPDFLASESGMSRVFDITTPSEVAKHTKRYGSQTVDYLLYSKPNGLVFP